MLNKKEKMRERKQKNFILKSNPRNVYQEYETASYTTTTSHNTTAPVVEADNAFYHSIKSHAQVAAAKEKAVALATKPEVKTTPVVKPEVKAVAPVIKPEVKTTPVVKPEVIAVAPVIKPVVTTPVAKPEVIAPVVKIEVKPTPIVTKIEVKDTLIKEEIKYEREPEVSHQTETFT